jgi:hypothetical protein
MLWQAARKARVHCGAGGVILLSTFQLLGCTQKKYGVERSRFRDNKRLSGTMNRFRKKSARGRGTPAGGANAALTEPVAPAGSQTLSKLSGRSGTGTRGSRGLDGNGQSGFTARRRRWPNRGSILTWPFRVPPMGNAGQSCLGVFELAAAIQPLRRPTDLVQRLFASDRIPGSPRDRSIPIPGSSELLVRSVDEPTEVDVRAALEAATCYARRMFDAILAAGAKPAPIFATGGWARSQAFIELRASIFGQPVIVVDVDEPELTAIGAALIAAQGATGVALPFGEGLDLRKIEPVAAWIEPYAGLCQDYRARLDAKKRIVSTWFKADSMGGFLPGRYCQRFRKA